MAKNNQPQENNGQKVQTKYDRKIEERRKQEEKDRRSAKIMRTCAILVGVIIVAAVVISVALPIVNKKKAMEDAYVTVGSHEITKLEFDYYYNSAMNSYLTTYSSFLAYMGLDASKDMDEQQYSDELTWKDFFDQMAVEQIRQTKSLTDDAAANNFTYDATEEYAGILTGMESGAESAGVTLEDYYKTTSGIYATQENMEPFMKEGLLAAAYYDSLMEKNAPGDQEIKDYYTANVKNYDKVDYRSFAFTAETAEGASEEDVNKAMTEAKSKADTMLKARQGGADFRELCLENATEENKASYEDKEKDASLKEGAYFSATTAAVAEWLYEDGRAKGDTAVVEDTEAHQYYVVEFDRRYYDEADDENISNTISSERTTEYIDKLMENYAVTDNKGSLKYLTADTDTADAAAAEEAAADESTAAESTADAAAEDTADTSAGSTADTADTSAGNTADAE